MPALFLRFIFMFSLCVLDVRVLPFFYNWMLSRWAVPASNLAWRVEIADNSRFMQVLLVKEAPQSYSMFTLDVQLRMRRKRFGIGCWRGTSPRIAPISSSGPKLSMSCHGVPWGAMGSGSAHVLRWILDDFLAPRPHSWDWRCVPSDSPPYIAMAYESLE